MIKIICLYCSGRCPFLGNIGDISLVSYIIDISGTMGALLIDATSNRSVIMYCNSSGQWDWSINNSSFDNAIVIDINTIVINNNSGQ